MTAGCPTCTQLTRMAERPIVCAACLRHPAPTPPPPAGGQVAVAILRALPLGFWLLLALGVGTYFTADPPDRHWYTIPGAMVLGFAASQLVDGQKRGRRR